MVAEILVEAVHTAEKVDRLQAVQPAYSTVPVRSMF
jgi:hypothetical protein